MHAQTYKTENRDRMKSTSKTSFFLFEICVCFCITWKHEIKFYAYGPETLRSTESLPVLTLNLPYIQYQMFETSPQEVQQMFHWHCEQWRCRPTLWLCVPRLHTNRNSKWGPRKREQMIFSIFASLGPFIKFKISATAESFFCFALFLHLIWSESLLTQFGPPLMWNQFRQRIKVCCSASNGQRLVSCSPRRPSARLGIDVWIRRCALSTAHYRVKERQEKLCHTQQKANTQPDEDVSKATAKSVCLVSCSQDHRKMIRWRQTRPPTRHTNQHCSTTQHYGSQN